MEPNKILIRRSYQNINLKPGSILVAILNGDFGDMLSKGFETETPLEHLAYTLVMFGLTDSCHNIYEIDEAIRNAVLESNDYSIKAKKLSLSFQNIFDTEEHYLDSNFFRDPGKCEFLRSASDVFNKWLTTEFNLSGEYVKNAIHQFNGKFCEALARLWHKQRLIFEKIQSFFENPFSDIFSEQLYLEAYRATLMSYYQGHPMGDKKLMLSDIYIDPKFQISRYHLANEDDYSQQRSDFTDVDFSGGLNEFIMGWLMNKKVLNVESEGSRFLILLGQPGQGKTSFCYKTLNALLNENNGSVSKVFFIKLKDVRLAHEIIEVPLETIRTEIGSEFYKIDTEARRITIEDRHSTLLLLDGLDELYMRQGLTNADLEHFLNRLSRDIGQYKNLYVIITCRYNYLNIKSLSSERYLILSIKEFSIEQQIIWLEKYIKFYPECKLKNDKIRAISNSIDPKLQDIKNLYNQPILLHLLAKSDFEPNDLRDLNRSQIYQMLSYAAVTRRKKEVWRYENLKDADLLGVLQTLAWQIFLSDFGYIRRNDVQYGPLFKSIEKLRTDMGMPHLEISDFFKELFVSFYFRNVPKSINDKWEQDRENYAVEFYHRSLYEYLAAEYVWRTIKEFFLDRKIEGDYVIDDEDDAFRKINHLFGNKMFTPDIASYYIEIIHNDEKPFCGVESQRWKIDLFHRLRKFFPYCLKNDFLYDGKTFNHYRKNKGLETSLSTFYGCIITLGALLKSINHRVTDNTLQQDSGKFTFYSENDEFFLKYTTYLILLRRFSPNLPLILAYQNLTAAQFQGANFSNIDFQGSNLSNSNFRGAEINKANFQKTVLISTNFTGAEMNNTNFKGANLLNTNFSHADVKAADFKNIEIPIEGKTIFAKADLRGVDLRSADIRSTDFSEADIRGGRLHGANLSGAVLCSANLGGVDLIGANLCNATLRNASLSNAELQGADFKDADLTRADLSRAYLALGGDLEGPASFHGARLDSIIGLETAQGRDLADFTNTIYDGAFGNREE